MSNDHIKRIKAQNLDAHIRVLKSEAQAQGSILSSVVSEKISAQNELTSLSCEIKKAKNELEGVKTEGRVLEDTLKKKESYLMAREMGQIAISKSFEEEKEEFEREKAAEMRELDAEAEKLRNTIKVTETAHKNLVNQYSKEIEALMDEKESARSATFSEIKELETINNSKKEAVGALSEATQALLSVVKEKDDALVERDTAIASKAEYAEALEEKNKDISRREADIQVWIRRLKKKHATMYPGKTLNI